MYLRSIIAIAGLLVTSCLSPHQTVVTDTGGGTWSESAEIEIPNADTVTPRDLYIVVRYNDSFRDDTLRLTIRTISPDSLVSRNPTRWAFLPSGTRQPSRRKRRFPIVGT